MRTRHIALLVLHSTSTILQGQIAKPVLQLAFVIISNTVQSAGQEIILLILVIAKFAHLHVTAIMLLIVHPVLMSIISTV